MAVCAVCEKRHLFKGLNRRLAIPEYRAMTGFWPWAEVRVCDGCLEEYERSFMERLRLLAPQVMESDEPISRQVCLVCGTVESAGPWHEVSKWVNRQDRPARHTTFYLCQRHQDFPYADGIVVSSNLKDAGRMAEVLDELPSVGGDLLARVEGWRLEQGGGPAGARDFAAGKTRDEAARLALEFWRKEPEDLKAKAAWLGPVRRDYQLRYRLDLVRDCLTGGRQPGSGRRETLSILRTAVDHFILYRTVTDAPVDLQPV
jgi:hypothetical protein